MNINSDKYSSYLLIYENNLRITNILLKYIFKIIKEIQKEYLTKGYLYGEKFDNKYIINNKLKIKNFINKKIKVYQTPLYKLDYFEIDIFKNILKEVLSENEYLTNIILRKSNANNKNFIEIISNKVIKKNNVFNNELFTDYHANNLKVSIANSEIELIKINFYNSLTNYIFNGCFKKSELYNKKFIHEALYTCNNFKFNANSKLVSKQQHLFHNKLIDYCNSFKNDKNFYRCELKFAFNNYERNFESVTNDDIKKVFFIN